MRWIVVAALTLTLTAPASAQQQGSPTEQVMGAKLMRELQEGLQCNITLLTAQQELAKANSRIADLEAAAQKKDAPATAPAGK